MTQSEQMSLIIFNNNYSYWSAYGFLISDINERNQFDQPTDELRRFNITRNYCEIIFMVNLEQLQPFSQFIDSNASQIVQVKITMPDDRLARLKSGKVESYSFYSSDFTGDLVTIQVRLLLTDNVSEINNQHPAHRPNIIVKNKLRPNLVWRQFGF